MITKSIIQKKCHDCGKDIKINDTIENGVLLTYEKDYDEIDIFKCDDCYNKDESLREYQPTEVYSRIVGYIRPVQNYNEGKKKEFEERKTFTR